LGYAALLTGGRDALDSGPESAEKTAEFQEAAYGRISGGGRVATVVRRRHP
jgi:hypothetical protein